VNYNGSCHCGQIVFAVKGELNEAVECNCSICSRKGAGQAENPMVVVNIRCLEEVAPSALAVRHFDGHTL